MRIHRAAVALFVLLVLLSSPAEARSIGFSAHDKVTFMATITSIIPNFPKNNVSTETTQFDMQIIKVDNSTEPATVTYNLTITAINGTTLKYPITTINRTTIFDPFDNRTYVGNAFCPFIYTDLPNGSRTNIAVAIPSNSSQFTSPPMYVNSSVVATHNVVYVGVVLPLIANSTALSHWYLKYNATDGVLENSTIIDSQGGYTTEFEYVLTNYFHSPPAPPLNLVPIAIASIVVVAGLIAAVALMRRPSRKQKKTERLRRRLGRG